jgi:hypothetical protein
MSNYTIEVTENVVNLDVLKDHDIIIEIKSSDNFITFDTPSGYPILFTSGILPVSRVGSGYLIENLTSGNTIVRTFGNQSISGIKLFNDNVIISGYLATRSEASNIGASHFPVFISDPSTFARNIHTRTPSQFKSDLAINNVQNIALTGVNFSAGSGLIGGGNLSANRSFDIGQGDGLVVSADNIAVDSTVVRTTGEQTLSGGKTFSGTGIKITTGAIGINRKDIILKGNTGTLFNNTITITPTNNLYTDRVYYLPEAGVDADFVMTAGSQIITGQKTFTSTVIFNSGTFQSLKLGGIDVSVSGHTHTSSSITDFNSSVSGLLPITLLTAGSGIGISGVGSNYTISTTGTFGLTQTQVDSRVNTLTSGIYAPLTGAVFTGIISGPSGSFTSLKVSNVDVSVSGHTHNIADITSLQTTLDNKQPSGNYALSSHTHASSNITDFNSSVSGLVNGIYAPLSSPSFSGVPLTPTATAGTNSTQIASTAFVRTEISNLVASAPTALDTLNELATALGNDANFSTTVTNNLAGKANLSGATFTGSISGPSGNFTSLKVNNVDVSANGHTHTISDITNLQTALDGKQPSGNYAASSHTHTSSNITDFNSSVSGLLPVKNILAGYDINITNNSGVYTVASTNLVHVDSQQPQGFVNRTDSRISVSGNIFRIEPTGSSYSYYNKGIKVVKTSGDSLTIPNLTQINYIHFDTVNNQISNKTTPFDFSSDIPIAYVAWNSGVGPSGQMTFFAEERHGIVMDTSTHKWIHNTFGMQYVDGLSIGNYVLGGNGSSNTHATISIGDGTLYQEDIQINVTDSSSTDPFCQELSPIAQIPVYYHQGTTGQWVKNTATDYPVKYGANGPQYNSLTGGNWTTPDVSPGGQTRYFAAWILATNQIDDPIISIMGQRYDGTEGAAENNNSWSDVNLTNLPVSEVKPLYRLIFAADSNSYTNVPKCRLLSILDIRVSVISTIAGVSQNDHGSLFGLGDDDHSQYLHVDNARTVNAIHNFVNGLTVNGTSVSVSGHTHTSSNITDFNSSVSGLLPVGTANYLSKFGTGGSGLSNSLIYDNGTNIGIGTSSPTATLEINGPLKFTNCDTRIIRLDNSNIAISGGVNNIGHFGLYIDNRATAAGRLYRLASYTDGTNGSFRIRDDSAGADRLIISSNGNVGIVTTTPRAILDVSGVIRSTSHITSDTEFRLNNAPFSRVATMDSAGSFAGGYNVYLSGQTPKHNSTGAISSYYYHSDGTIRFYTNSSQSADTNASERLRITSTGDIGIGTTTPSKKLDVIGDARVSGVLNLVNASDSTDRSIAVTSNNMTFAGVHGIFEYSVGLRGSRGSACGLESNATNGYLALAAGGSEKVRIATDGKVGIGTTTPSTQLHVIGSGVISSGLIVNGNLTFDSFTESVVAIGNSSTSQTISLTSGTVQTCTLTGNCTFTMPTATAGKSFSLFLNSGSGNYTATFTGVRWADSAIPTATITASKVDIYSFISDGTYWYGSFSQNYG